MAGPSVALVGGRNEALERLFAEAGLDVLDEWPQDGPAPELVAIFGGAEMSLRSVHERHPLCEVLLIAEADGGVHGAARSLGADVIVLPADRRRTLDTIEQALARRAARARHQSLVERVRGLDPTLAGEVAELARQSEHRARHLEEAVRLRSSFIANISHEVRTPVTIMHGMLDILADDLRGSLSPDQLDLWKRVRQCGQDLLDLVQGILDLSKADSGVLEARPVRVYFPDLVTDVLGAVEPALEKTGVRLVVDVPRGVEWLTVDGTRLRQLLGSLLSNAAKFTSTGEVRLEARLVGPSTQRPEDDPATLLRSPVPTGDTLQISVVDTGKGISPADQELIFEAFRQVDVSATREHEGIGIGLAIVRQTAKLLGASVELESRLGAGTTFRVRLPVTPASAPAASAEEAARKAGTAAKRRVADPRGVLPELAGLLRVHGPTETDTVSFALDALERLLRPQAAFFAVREEESWIVRDGLGGCSPRERPPLPFPALTRIASQRQAVHDTGSGWSACAAGQCLLAARPAAGEGLATEDLQVLEIVARWLDLELERHRLERERGELIASLGRDVKTPLGSLLAYTQGLLRGLRGDLTPEQREVVLKLERSLHGAVLSTLDLLDYERAIHRSLAAPDHDFPLERVLDHVLARHAAALELGRHPVHRSLPAGLPLCRGDEIRTDRALSALLRALVDGLADEEPIEIEAGTQEDRVWCLLRGRPSDSALFLEGLRRTARPLEIRETLRLRLARAGIEAQRGEITVAAEASRVTIRVAWRRGDRAVAP